MYDGWLASRGFVVVGSNMTISTRQCVNFTGHLGLLSKVHIIVSVLSKSLRTLCRAVLLLFIAHNTYNRLTFRAISDQMEAKSMYVNSIFAELSEYANW